MTLACRCRRVGGPHQKARRGSCAGTLAGFVGPVPGSDRANLAVLHCLIGFNRIEELTYLSRRNVPTIASP